MSAISTNEPAAVMNANNIENDIYNDTTKNVVIVGAGPAGLLLSCLLLNRNIDNNNVDNGIQQPQQPRQKYKVILVESRTDLGLLDPQTDELKAHKSWMIGLAGHGLEAIRKVPNLYEDYVSKVGVPIRKGAIILGSKKMEQSLPDNDDNKESETFVIDRNYVCAAIARYLQDHHSNDPYFERRYETKLQYVDYENHRILTRRCGRDNDDNDDNHKEEYTKYDLLIGADGIRSIVRESLVRCHFDFEMDIGDIFTNFKAIHVALPKALSNDSLCLLPDIFPHMAGVGLPEQDGMINITIAVPRNKFNDIPEELKSNDAMTVAKFLQKNMKCFELVDYDDFAKQWVDSRWNRTCMVHCNFYHSIPCKIALMGDAAHATSPSIGMGMNTALRDAQKFVEILDLLGDDHITGEVLSEYSKERVKEGNSLTDLAYNLYCHDTTHQMIETIHMIVRGLLNNLLPSLVAPHPQMRIGFKSWSLSDVYQLANEQGIIQKHRQINYRIRQEHFERECGMITRTISSNHYKYVLACIFILVLSIITAWSAAKKEYVV